MQFTPHDHVWHDQNLGGGLHRSVCARCNRIAVESIPRTQELAERIQTDR